MSYYVPDEETGLGASLFDKSGPSIEFAEQEVRLGFIRKVFGECIRRHGRARSCSYSQKLAATAQALQAVITLIPSCLFLTYALP